VPPGSPGESNVPAFCPASRAPLHWSCVLSVALHSCTHQLHVCLCAVLVQAGGGAQLYIISLGVLAPYRDQGIGVTP
jgi:hypothetical protein